MNRKIRFYINCIILCIFIGIKANAQENKTYFLHTIEKGQSLYSISTMYGISEAEIIKLNPGSNQKIYAGSTLRIPIKGGVKQVFHTIEKGETLYRLTKKYNVSAKAICDANPGLTASNFKSGEVILIPLHSTSETQTGKAKEVMPKKAQQPVVSRCKEMVRINKKISISKFCKKYNLTREELVAVNPELKVLKKLHDGDYVCIPWTEKDKEKLQEKAEKNIIEQRKKNKDTQDSQLSTEDIFKANNKKEKQYKSIKAAVILPFTDGIPEGDAERMVEYYEGLLLAVDSLKKEGVNLDIFTYNSGTTIQDVNNILSKPEMKAMNIIFGPLYQQQVEPLAEFAKQNKIRLVIPFTSKDNSVFTNPYIFQINTPQSYLYSEVYEHFVRQFKNANVIFLKKEGTTDKDAFIRGLKQELHNRDIKYITLSDTVSSPTLTASIDSLKQNIFIPTTGKSVALTDIIPDLLITVNEHPNWDIHLFGYPEWQTYTGTFLDNFFTVDTYFYSSFYTNNILKSSKDFSRKFTHWYGKIMEERFPKFGMLGFDTAYFFLKGLSLYGNKFEENMNKLRINPIQTGFKFERANNWGGFINRKVFFIHFSKDYELIKLSYE